jgi:hypothetical protein
MAAAIASAAGATERSGVEKVCATIQGVYSTGLKTTLANPSFSR